jgi:hypothetical protein
MVWPWLSTEKKNPNTKNVMHAIGSGRGHYWQKRGKNEKCFACRLVLPWLPMGQNFEEKQKKSCLPYGLAVAIIGKKKGNTKNVTHAVWSGHDCHGAKKNEKQKNVTHKIWCGVAVIWKNQKRKMSWTPYGLAMAVISEKKEQGKMSRMPSGLALFADGQIF